MCGLAGVLSAQPQNADGLIRTITRMSLKLQHRGPDDGGTWVDAEARCGLAFRRLAILDLSPNGHQPMTSPAGRYTLVFNGEIYNHRDLRRDLEAAGYRFRGHSDTETLCAAFEHWGVHDAISRCIGMFAIAAWDRESRSLCLIRDRLGIKPLYLYQRPGLVLFGSELKALHAHPQFQPELDTDAVDMFLRYLYVPAPSSIFRGVSKVLPGHIVTITLPELDTRSEAFWSLRDAYERGQREPFEGTASEAVAALEQLLLDAVSIRKLADVPLGALLSGGVDSSTVVALMQAGSAQPTRTFSIGFTSGEHDESVHAARVAKHLGTVHTDMMLDGAASLHVVRELPYMYDEPLADPSQIPTYLVSRMARTDVTVALTGDGGDEVFAGYNRYIDGQRIIARATRLPLPLRQAASAALRRLSNDWYPMVAPLANLGGQRLMQQKIGKLSRVLAAGSGGSMYQSLLSAWQNPESALVERHSAADAIADSLSESQGIPLLDRMMLVDQATYLPDDLLAKVDRASMAVSLEARVPLLDHRVIELAWRMPAKWKIRNGRGKWLLREVLYRHVPKELVDRPKVGFTVPIEEWLRGPLRPWADSTLHNVGEPLDRRAIVQVWHRFQNGESGLALAIWAVVMLQAWRHAWSY